MKFKAFTLAELLIALAILGVIATFTIPKVLFAHESAKDNAIAKEAIAMISGAYSQYQVDATATSATTAADFTPYMNYVWVDTNAAHTIDDSYNAGTDVDCDNVHICLKLANGSVLMYFTPSFGGTNATNALQFHIDPDGVVTDGTTNGPGKALDFWLYYNGRITTNENMTPNTCTSFSCYNPGTDPPWFSWN